MTDVPDKARIMAEIKSFKSKKGVCHDRRKLGKNSDALMWFEAENGCNRIGPEQAVRLLFACCNTGYWSVEVDFKLRAADGLVQFSAPVEGTLPIFSPPPEAEYEFDYNFSNVTATVAQRKENCFIDWVLRRGEDSSRNMTKITVTTL